MENQFLFLKSVTPVELAHLNQITASLSDDKIKNFTMMYTSKRRESEMILILTIIGLFGFAGLQRFLTGQVGMGVLYLLTGGLCFIGTILDIVNHKKLTDEYNISMANETLQMIQ